MIPAPLDGADLVVTLQPVEAVQLQPHGRVHVVERELGAAAALEQHQGTPILFGVSAPHLTEEFHGLPRHMFVLHTHDSIGVIALIPERFDIYPAKHVAIHEQSAARYPIRGGAPKSE